MEIKEALLQFQKNEITEHLVYKALAKKSKGENASILDKISNDELRHYNEWRKYTGKEAKPRKFIVFLYLMLSKLFGITFALKLMENGEKEAEETYKKIIEKIPEAAKILADEEEHEKMLINMIKEERIEYVGSMMLGLNDALVELTGALAGFTFALQKSRIIAIVGLITGIAASLSMAASEFLARKMEGGKSPTKASLYTGFTYIAVVLLLTMPFFIFLNPFLALLLALSLAIFIIFLFTFFISVVKEQSFKKLFGEMASISMGIAFLSFIIGWLIKIVFGIEM